MVHSAAKLLAAAVIGWAFTSGTVFAQAKGAPAANSGFLPDYSKLAPAADNPQSRRWVNKDFDFKPFNKILLDPVEVFVSPASEYKGASPDVLKRMSDNFTGSFKKALQPGYTLVDKPGPDVLHIRLAITGVNLVKPGMNPTDALPIKFLFKAATGGFEAKNAVLTGEMQVLDPSNNIVAAVVSQGTSNKTLSEKQSITWQDLQSITEAWSANLRKGLDTARGVAAK